MGITFLNKPLKVRKVASRQSKFSIRDQGKVLEAEDADSLRGAGFLLRLYDTQDWQERTGCDSLITGKQPADFLLLMDGKAIFIEDKSTRNPLYFPLQNLRTHQLEAGKKAEDEGAFHFHHIAYYPARKPPTSFLVRTVDLYRTYILHVNQGLLKWYWHLVSRDCVKVPRLEGSRWDIERVLKEQVSIVQKTIN